ncbi:MAG: hypothetical protein EXR89_06295 [Methylococcaceae bacterium]|nr:hypothetical protein [Methylococcaceae bacterium]
MKPYSYVWAIILMATSVNSWAYGSNSSSNSCVKPKFSNFTPAENSAVTTGSYFSFTTSENTTPNTIKVTIKEQPITLKIDTEQNGSFKVSGKIPALLTGDYARISIVARGQNDCAGDAGWLVKISK